MNPRPFAGFFKALDLDPWLLGYGADLLWIQFASGSWIRSPFPTIVSAVQDFSLFSAFAQVLAGIALIAFCLSAWGTRLAPGRLQPFAYALPLGPIGVALLVLTPQASVVAGLAFGIGCLASFVLWGCLISHHSDISITANVLLGQLAGALLIFLVAHLPYPFSLVTVLGALAVSCGMLLIKTFRTNPHNRQTKPDAESRNDEQYAGRKGLREMLFGITRKDWLQMVLVFTATVIAAMTSGAHGFLDDGWYRFGINSLVIPLVDSALACASIVLYHRYGAGINVCFIVFPLLSAVAVIIQFISGAHGTSISGTIVFALDYLANIFGFAFVCVLAGKRPRSAVALFTLMRTMMAIALASSLIMSLTGHATLVAGVAEGTLFVSMLIGAGVWLLGGPREPKEPSPAGAGQRDRMAEVAQTFGMSNREREIASWLIKGYQAPYIANQLSISENTVRSHVKNIYRKCGVSSRNSFLALFDGNEEGDTH